MNQGNAGVPIDPHAVVVRPAVPHGFAHRSGYIADRPRRVLRPACNKARDTAHPLNPNLPLASLRLTSDESFSNGGRIEDHIGQCIFGYRSWLNTRASS